MNIKFKHLGRFRRQEDGSATIEFALLFPVFITLFLMGFESGFYMVRSVMLERAVDVTVRDIRLGNGRVPQYADLRRSICDTATVLPDCADAVQVQMERVDIVPGGIDKMRGNWNCITSNSSANREDDTTYDVGEENTMMVLRVCMLQSPFFPTTGIGAGLDKNGDGKFAMVATSAFVNEPGTRAFAADASGGAGELQEAIGVNGDGSDGSDGSDGDSGGDGDDT